MSPPKHSPPMPERHHPSKPGPSAAAGWRTIPDRGAVYRIAIIGAVGSGKTRRTDSDRLNAMPGACAGNNKPHFNLFEAERDPKFNATSSARRRPPDMRRGSPPQGRRAGWRSAPISS
jgi:hypothetical protein